MICANKMMRATACTSVTARPRLPTLVSAVPVARPCRSIRTLAAPEETTQAPAAAKKEEDVPVWVRRENERKLQEEAPAGLPWGLYLLFSCFCAIASVGSIFEYSYGNALFGLVQPNSPLWAPILLTFAVTGIPTAGFLFFKGINAFNEDADRQNKLDGYN